MKKILLLSYILCLTTGLSAQTEEEELFALLKPVGTDQADSVARDSAIAAMPWPSNVQARLDLLMGEPLLKKTQLGLLVYDLTADSAIYKCGEQQTLRPASTMKLVTAITALDKLGGGYQFRTSLYYTGKVSNRTLCGNLYCVGGMDPQFDGDDMQAFVESIRKLGVDTIRGQIVADYSMKDESRLGEGWCWDDDNPVLTPLLIDKKDRFLERFLQQLRSAGICVDAPFSEGSVPNGAAILCSRFHSLEQILNKMMKESDNLYAESMYYQLAAAGGARRVSADRARQWERKLVGRLGLNAGEYKFADGSGLSLYNYVSAELMVRLLRFAFQNQDIYARLAPALPIAGVDGTLEKRMKGPYTGGNVRAKTGTLTGISSLAGYCTAANGHQLAFCIINQGVMRNASGRTFQDKVCTALCRP
ncbi:MAG: D-alanyl-D-alanine carboxypeptidase/D-alanyl-D-alanine-endopeptidase [Prevotella sp.]|nr:D-alanyl-D-alanine carboxypeptidase/D-alanyl-D-alanine-endopeptidase [Prevotella sp.]